MEESKVFKKCSKCQEIKSIDNYNSAGCSYKEKKYIRGECKACAKIYNSSEKFKIIAKKYRQTEERKEYNRLRKKDPTYKAKQLIYAAHRLKNNPLIKLKHNIRARTRIALLAKRWYKMEKFNQYIGCSLDDLKKHMEKQFTEGMTWETYGHGHNKWTIDHVIPLSSATTPEEMYKLCHYSNLQPMWYQDNIAKSNKIK